MLSRTSRRLAVLTNHSVLRISRVAYSTSIRRCNDTSSITDKVADGDLRSVRSIFDTFRNRGFVITGGGRGIGYAITRAIAEMGGNVAVIDILPQPVKDFESLADEFGVTTNYINGDVTKEESLSDAFQEAATRLGSIDGCVTAAGIAVDKPYTEHSWNDVTRILDINVTGTFFASQMAVKQMRKQGTGGSIVMIASICAHCTAPGHRLAAYNASKGAVKMLSTALSVELAPEKIRTNTISPGYIETDMTRSLRDEFPHLVELMHKAPPIKRIGNRNDLTPAVIYLLSDASSYTTGADILITGGLHAGRIEA